MRRLPNSDAFHPTEWSPALPALARRRGVPADVELSLRVERDGTQLAVMRQTVSEGGMLRTIAIDAIIR